MPNAPKRSFHIAAADIKAKRGQRFVLEQLRSVPLDTLRRQGLRRDV